MHKHGWNKLVTTFRLFYVIKKNTRSIILDFNLSPFSFHRLNDRQSQICLHAANDTTTAKIYIIFYLHFSSRQISPTTDDVFKIAQAINHNF